MHVLPLVAASIYMKVQRIHMISNRLYSATGGGIDLEQMLADGPYYAISVAMERWNVQHRVFAFEQFFRNNESVVTVQCFCVNILELGLKVQCLIKILYSDGLQRSGVLVL